MMIPWLEQTSWMAAVIRHLWQSTIVCVVLWTLTLILRRNRAKIRFRLWLLASIKFLLPFGLLITAGEHLSARYTAPTVEPFFSFILEGPASQPQRAEFPHHSLMTVLQTTTHQSAPSSANSHSIGWIIAFVWASGSFVVIALWLWQWFRARSMMLSGEQLSELEGVRVRMVPGNVEPGIFGLLRPVLLLPRGMRDHLSPVQFRAIVEHELCHARRYDNLTAAMHRFISAIFWFHPMVWWIGRQLIEEREAACDEAVLENAHTPLVYAEGILNVCKFYMEVPLNTISGVTGADLKRRIAYILSERGSHRLDLARKLALGTAAVLALTMPIALGMLHASKVHAQTAKQNIDDTWQGTLHVQKDLRLVLKVTKASDGTLKSNFYSIDQGGQPLPVKETTFQGGELKLNVEAIDGTYVGKMSPDGSTITGEWKQGDQPRPLILARATPETAWTIPEPPPKLPPMAAGADPTFEVATIKPSDPATKGKGFGGPPGHFQTRNTTLNDLIMFSYDVNTKQIVGGPSWMETDKFDIVTGQPDVPGAPNERQIKSMMRKLLVSRFGLKFHEDKKELSAYVLTVAKDGPKLTKSDGDPNTPHAFFFTKLGNLTVRNATMDDFANGMQGAVFDRPVVNRTGLEGRWNCSLKWTPDETQFQVFGVKITPNEAADAPPPIFTAIQEQIGLKFDAAKTMVNVMVLDHVEKPSEN